MTSKKKVEEAEDFHNDSMDEDQFGDEENFEKAGFSIHDSDDINHFSEDEGDSFEEDEEEDEFKDFEGEEGEDEEEDEKEEKKNKDEENLEDDLFGLGADDLDKYREEDNPFDNYKEDEEEIL